MLYLLTHEMQPVPLGDVKLSGTAQVPKKKKQTLKFTAAGDHFAAKVDVKGAHRYAVEIMTVYKGKKEKLVFQVEPQS